LHDGHPWDLLRTHWEGVTQVVISELRRQELAELMRIPSGTIRVVPNGVDINAFFKFEPKPSSHRKVELIGGRPFVPAARPFDAAQKYRAGPAYSGRVENEYPQAMLLVTGPEGPHNPNNKAYKQKLIAVCVMN
jgi:mannosylglucosylglycerate synthase